MDSSLSGRRAAFVEVALRAAAARIGRPLTYAVPPDCQATRGQLVLAPLGRRVLGGLVVQQAAGPPPEVDARPLLAVLGDVPLLAEWQLRLAEWIARRYASSLASALAGFLPPAARGDVRLTLDRTASVAEAEAVRQAFGRRRAMTASAASKLLGDAALGRALRAGILRPELGPSRVQVPLEQVDLPPAASQLSRAQATVFAPIREAIRAHDGQGFLLHGVTGSGKTHVYLHAVREAVAAGGQALVLVSDISLVPAAERHYATWFPGLVAVLHSERTEAEQRDAWTAIARGRARVVLGARSALFAPLVAPHLVVVDEEHEPAYKQQDLSPGYHAREVALELGELTGAPVILGSATPDVGTYARAIGGELRLLELAGRFDHGGEMTDAPADAGGRAAAVRLPRVEVVDMRAELAAGHTSIFSRALLRGLGRALDLGEQAILYLNRRGTATCVICRDCGHTVACADCQLPMIYHGDLELLLCHHCNRRRRAPTRCPGCDGPRIRYLGTGTQRVADEVLRHFPRARLLRWDRDTASGRGAHEQLWAAFNAGTADVLVGTQMVAKGLDFPRVTLVGVVLADTGLYLPDYRASERAFQLLTQVAGRAGRGARPGEVIVQTYSPGHYAVQAARRHDFSGFAERELQFRAEHSYPPVRRLARLVYSAENEARCWREGGRVLRELRARVAERGPDDAQFMGPAPAFLRRPRGRYRWQLVIAANEPERVLTDYALPSGWTVDVDPVSML